MLAVTRLLTATFLIPSLAIAVPAYAEVRTAAEGGGGGGPFAASCPTGYMLRGLTVRSGSYIDAVTADCINPFKNLPPLSIDERRVGFYGGNGGGEASVLCANKQNPYEMGVISGMVTERIRAVTSLQFRCGPTPPGSPDDVSYTPNAGGPDKPSWHKSLLRCPVGLVPTGVFGRSGKWVDQIGLICDNPPTYKG